MKTNNSLSLLNCNDSLLLNQLDWNLILEKISSFLLFESTKKLLYSPFKIQSTNRIIHFNDLMDDILQLLKSSKYEQLLPLIGKIQSFEKCINLISRVEKESILSIQELNTLAIFIDTFIEIFSLYHFHIQKISIHYKIEFPKNHHTLLKQNFLIPFRKLVSIEGGINYEEHFELRPLHLKLKELEQDIRASLKIIMNSNTYKNSLQFSEYDIINERFVIPIRSDSYRSAYGNIIAHSESGQTLYVEPFSIRTKSEQRKSLLAAINEILFRLCKEYSLTLSSFFTTLFDYGKLIEYFDLTLAKGRFILTKSLVKPTIISKPIFILENCFHPLLDNPVSNTISLEGEHFGLLISGPNTGGKSVLLKSIALTHLFLHFGLFVPAKKASLYPFTKIFFLSNDHQNISAGLSSFSAEVKNYLQVYNETLIYQKTNLLDIESESNENLEDDINSSLPIPTSLIIIDEIFNSTSSEDASVLAFSYFEELRLKGHPLIKILASTHHQLLKTYIHESPHYLSSHVGYDYHSDNPTYKILLGTPGSSMAISIFKKWLIKFNLPMEMSEKANSMLNEQSHNYDKLLSNLILKEQKINILQKEYETLNRELTKKIKNLENNYKLKFHKRIEELESEFQKIHKKAEQLVLAINSGENNDRKRASIAIHDLSVEKRNLIKNSDFQELSNENDTNSESLNIEQSTVKKNPEKVDSFKIGSYYTSSQLNCKVQILSLDQKKKTARVSAGKIKMQVPYHDLSELSAGNRNSPSTSTSNKNSYFEPILLDDSKDNTYLDCRGMRLDLFQDLIEQALDRLLLGTVPFIMVIHGHGDGVLKKWLRDFLKKGSEFKWEIPEQYRDGATRIFL